MQLATEHAHLNDHILNANNLEDFTQLVSQSFVPLKLSESSHCNFSATLRMADSDNIFFTEVNAHPHMVERTIETINSGGAGYYKVSLLLEGSSILVQDGKELVMNAGDISIYDTSRPYSLIFNENFRNLIMMFPKNRFQLPISYTEQLTAIALNKEHPALSPVVTSFLSQFPSQLHQLDEQLRIKLSNTSLDLVSTLISSILDTRPESRNPRQMLLQKIFRYIETHLTSPDLTPNTIASHHYISIRHLHALFQEAGTTVSAMIRERRLERCRLDLVDPVLADRNISAVAAKWGFTDAAHFSRLFKATYGVSPSEVRQHH